MKHYIPTRVRIGVDELKSRLEALKRPKIALMMNHMALDADGRNLMDVIPAEWKVEVPFLIGMEHGVRGNLYSNIRSHTDKLTGLPVRSLYDFPRALPTPELVEGLDAVVFCAQDAGVRHYTYLPWLTYLLDACAKAGVSVWVLDRPNPLGGVTVEGRGVEEGRRSLVGGFDYPLRHGLTAGEMAYMYNETHRVGCDLHVVRMEGWRRSMWYEDTGLLWLPPSPNIPTPMTCLAFASTGLTQSTNISHGIGTTTPFMVAGAAWADGRRLADGLNALDLDGVYLTDRFYMPSFDRTSPDVCYGAVLNFTDREAYRPYDLQLHLLSLFGRLYGGQVTFQERSYDQRVGSSEVREMMLRGDGPDALLAAWHANAAAFAEARKPYLLYD